MWARGWQSSRMLWEPLTLGRHLSLILQIALVANHDYRKVILVLDPEYLLLECSYLFE